MTGSNERPSILSRGERDVADRLRAGESVDDIADARDTTAERVAKTIDRIREKTERAFVTLAESPFADEIARGLDPEIRDALPATRGEPAERHDDRSSNRSSQ